MNDVRNVDVSDWLTIKPSAARTGLARAVARLKDAVEALEAARAAVLTSKADLDAATENLEADGDAPQVETTCGLCCDSILGL